MNDPVSEPDLSDPEELSPEEMSIPTVPTVPVEPARPKRTPPPTNPALTINIQSWATPIVGILMLVIGLLGGYFLRPVLNTPILAEATEDPSAASAVQPTSPAANATTAPVPEDQAARQQQLMDMVVAQTRHFKGPDDATVTLIEFSDFQ